MATPLRVLLLEDSEDDAKLILRELTLYGFAPEWTRVDTESGFVAELGNPFDVVIADYMLPQYDGMRALKVVQDKGLDIPFIVVTGTLGDEMAVAFMKRGAADYLLKDRLARLGTAVEEALEERRLRQEKLELEAKERLLRGELEARNLQLDQKVRELEALNRLFQKHLNERFTVVDAYRQLLMDLEVGPQDVKTILQRAREHPLPDLSEVRNHGEKDSAG